MSAESEEIFEDAGWSLGAGAEVSVGEPSPEPEGKTAAKASPWCASQLLPRGISLAGHRRGAGRRHQGPSAGRHEPL
eukprot:COSAG05_NODE_780_length_7383_cov_123.317408_2_plen_77_part_00